jgi:ureidoacrylate peracid hydrolase
VAEGRYYDPSAWRLVPGRTVHVVIDAQNDFLHPEGWYATHGIDIAHMQRVVGPITRLNQACRASGVTIVWTRHGTYGVEDGGPFMRKRVLLLEGGLRKETWGYEIVEELAPRAGEDRFVEKTRLSAFFRTELEEILHELGAETVLLTGVLTNQCVGATCKDALFRDFMPVVVEECVGTATPSLHEPALEMIRVGWGQVNTLAETLEELAAFPQAAIERS